MPAELHTTLDDAGAPADTALAFQREAGLVIGLLQQAVSRILAAFPEVKRATDLKRALDLDTALAWQVFSLAHVPEPLAASRFIPKAGAMRRFITSSRTSGAPSALSDAVAIAFENFERFVDARAGDRAKFTAILSSLQPDDRASWVKLRKAAYRACSGVWGVAVDCSVNCAIFHQRPTGEFDALSIRGRLGIHGFRPNVAVAMSVSTRTWGQGRPPPETIGADTDAAPVVTSRADLIPSACSQPLPQIEPRVGPDGTSRDYLKLCGLGRQSEATAWWTTMSADFPGSVNPPHGCSCPCPEPTELLVVDLLVPQGWSTPSTVRARTVGPDVRFSPSSLADALPLESRAVHLGGDLSSLFLSAAPAYSGLVTDELRRYRWQDTPFDLFRCTIKYPVLHTTTHLFVE